MWVSDIAHLLLVNGDWVVPGRAYLCAFQDMGTKHVVGWHVAATMPEKLVTAALQRAFFAQSPILSLLVHSDRGRTR